MSDMAYRYRFLIAAIVTAAGTICVVSLLPTTAEIELRENEIELREKLENVRSGMTAGEVKAILGPHYGFFFTTSSQSLMWKKGEIYAVVDFDFSKRVAFRRTLIVPRKRWDGSIHYDRLVEP